MMTSKFLITLHTKNQTGYWTAFGKPAKNAKIWASVSHDALIERIEPLRKYFENMQTIVVLLYFLPAQTRAFISGWHLEISRT